MWCVICPRCRHGKLGAVFNDERQRAEESGKTGLALVAAAMSGVISAGARNAVLAGSPLRNLGDFIRTTADGAKSAMETAFEKYLLETDRMGATFSSFVKEYTGKLDDWIAYHRKDADGAAMERWGERPGEAGRFYGSSYFADPMGKIVAKAGEDSDELLVCDMDLDMIRDVRYEWQFFKNRRAETYGPLADIAGV